MSDEAQPSTKISRRDFLKLAVNLGAGAALGTAAGEFVINFKDIDIPEADKDKLKFVFEQQKELFQKIETSEKVRLPYPNPEDIFMVFHLNKMAPLAMRYAQFANPDDFRPWITGEGQYEYNFKEASPEISGGLPKRQKQAREILNVYFANDQYRISQVKLSEWNKSPLGVVQWEVGSGIFNDPKTTLLPDDYKRFLHELTHAGTPFGMYKEAGVRDLLLPYGLRNTLDHTSGWLNAMIAEYPYYSERFFHAEDDKTLGMIREGGKGSLTHAIGEMEAMSCADYLYPPGKQYEDVIVNEREPFQDYPLTENMIRKSIAYVHYGVNALREHPNGVDQRGDLARGTICGDIFQKVLDLYVQENRENKEH